MRGLRIQFVGLLLSSVTFWAQTPTATISGRVLDPTRAVIPGAIVDAVNVGTNIRHTAETNGNGLFTIVGLVPGVYRMEISKPGFRTVVKTDILLHVQDVVALNFDMSVGSTAETVTVEGGAPLVNTQDAAISTVVDRRFVENMPLNGRSFQSLITLTPGVVLTKATFGEQGQFSTNGQRADANYFTVDGVSANVAVSPAASPVQLATGALPGLNAFGGTNSLVSLDAMQEFRVQTSTYAPEFGRGPGGQVQIVTRSGTNQLHGTVFDYLRNDVFDANDWFANHNGLKKPPLRQNDFGGVVGGPILKDRTFFFFSYEGLRLRQPLVVTTEVPSLASRQAASSQIQTYLNAFPLPNGPSTANGAARFSASFSNPSSLDATSIKIDQVVNHRLSIFGRYNNSPSSVLQRSGNSSALNEIFQTNVHVETVTLGAAWTITSSLNSDFRINLSRTRGATVIELDAFGGAVVPNDSVLFPAGLSRRDSFFSFNLSGQTNANWGIGRNADNRQRQVNVVENLSHVNGAHQLKVGFDFRRLSPLLSSSKYSQTAFFSNTATAITGKASSVFLGSAVVSPVLIHYMNLSTYAQDTWKMTRRLAFTYGLRWDVNPAPSGDDGHNPAVVTGLENPSTISLAPFGTPIYQTTYNNVAPRAGVAYQLGRHQGYESALRGGLGIFYDVGNQQTANAFAGFPFSTQITLANTKFPLTAAQAQPPALTSTPPFSTLFESDPDLKLPRTYQWNVSIEQQLGTQRMFSLSYVGAAGRKLLRTENLINPNPNFTSIRATGNKATSDYDALQLQFQQRLWHGLQAVVSYTWSKSLDTASNDSALLSPTIKLDPSIDRGPSDFDIRHNMRAAVTYSLPQLGTNWLDKALLNGWGLDANVTVLSGTPVNIMSTRNIGFGNFSLRPDLVPGLPLYLDDPAVPGNRRINKSAFVVPVTLPGQTGRQGTLGRNSLRGFATSQIDMALRRQLNLTERFNLQFRAEAFNVLNHPNFADPVGSLTSGFFGQSTSMLGGSFGTGGSNGGFNPLYQVGRSRSMQLSLKLGF